jgi:hypothetical protein
MEYSIFRLISLSSQRHEVMDILNGRKCGCVRILTEGRLKAYVHVGTLARPDFICTYIYSKD